MTEDKAEDALEACKDTVLELKVENDELREAAETFGDLAERLNRALITERVQHPDAAAAAPACPRCGKAQHVHPIPPSTRGDALHCDYCGNSWH
jgi:hypothetical protein